MTAGFFFPNQLSSEELADLAVNSTENIPSEIVGRQLCLEQQINVGKNAALAWLERMGPY